MLQSIDTASQTKERPRAILGRLQVSAPPPAKYEYIPEYEGQRVFQTFVSAMESGQPMETICSFQEATRQKLTGLSHSVTQAPVSPEMSSFHQIPGEFIGIF